MSNGSVRDVLEAPQTPADTRLRARLVGVVVSLEVVADDGEVLHPIELQPVRVPASEWSGFDVNEALAQVQTQLDGQT